MFYPQIRPALTLLGLMTLLTGVLYPVSVTGIAQVLFPQQANGSVIMYDGAAVGSALIGQPFDEPGYFWGRPSATPGFAYNAAASAGSNLAPSSAALVDAVHARLAALQLTGQSAIEPVPVDLVTASASGLDPHISVAAARYQTPRVAAARGMNASKLNALIAQHTEVRTVGLLGEPRVNVLQLNLALDALSAAEEIAAEE